MKNVFKLVVLVSILALLPISNLSTHAQANDPEKNKALLTAFFQAEARRDYTQMDLQFTSKFTRHSIATEAVMPQVNVKNLQDYKDFLLATATMFPDYYNKPQMLVADGNYVTFYTTWSGTYAQNGNVVTMPMIGIARIDSGRIAEMWIEWDNLTWNTQMNKTPARLDEAPISSIDDVVGVWSIQITGWNWLMQLKADGTMLVGPRGCTGEDCIDQGTFTIEGKQLVFQSSTYRPSCGKGRFDGFVSKQDGKPARLRFVTVGEDCYAERQESLKGKTLYPAVP